MRSLAGLDRSGFLQAADLRSLSEVGRWPSDIFARADTASAVSEQRGAEGGGMGEGEGCLPGTNGKATVVSLKSFNSEDCVRCDGSRQGLPMVRWTATRTHRGGPNAYWREVRFRCVSPGRPGDWTHWLEWGARRAGRSRKLFRHPRGSACCMLHWPYGPFGKILVHF